jgi:hypothetical protein
VRERHDPFLPCYVGQEQVKRSSIPVSGLVVKDECATSWESRCMGAKGCNLVALIV